MSSATINAPSVASKRAREVDLSAVDLDTIDETVRSQVVALLESAKKEKKEESPTPAVGTVTPEKATIPPAECPPAPKKKKKDEAVEQAPPTEEDWVFFATLTDECSELSGKQREKKTLGDRLISHMRTDLGTDEHTVGDHVFKIRETKRLVSITPQYLKGVLTEHGVDEETVEKITASIESRPKNTFHNLSVV